MSLHLLHQSIWPCAPKREKLLHMIVCSLTLCRSFDRKNSCCQWL